MNPTIARTGPALSAKFDACAPGARLRFTTRHGKGHTSLRTGTVTKVTAESVHVECDPLHHPSAARLTRAGWNDRNPKILLKDKPTVTHRAIPDTPHLSTAVSRLNRHAALASAEPLFHDIQAALDASHMPRARDILTRLLGLLEGAFANPGDTSRAAALQVISNRLPDLPLAVRVSLFRDAR